jgi:phenylalanyl-tRNA synthetase beta chain
MKFTLSWLKQHLSVYEKYSVDDITNTLTSIGLEVEDVRDDAKIYVPFKVARILEANPHPDAQKLQVCKVDDGNEVLQIVCGAANARAGIKVVLAPIASVVPGSGLVIKQSKIRGVESYGMLCSASELMISGDDCGILELSEDAPIGASFAHYMKDMKAIDTTVEIALTPNRGDAASLRGIARDLSAAGMGELIPLQETDLLSVDNHSAALNCRILCPEYCQEFWLARIDGVNNKGQLEALEAQLSLIDMSPKSPLVTLSNHLMFDIGRPNHIYDLNKINGEIAVRLSQHDEEFIAIGGQEYKLPSGIMVIADEQKILAIAGVMGGELSKVDENTTNVLVEMANFHPDAVAQSGRALNLLSDSRYRFERRVDSSISQYAISKLCNSITTLLGGKIVACAALFGKALEYRNTLQLNSTKISEIIGTEISQQYILNLLDKLGFGIHDDGITIAIPPYRWGDIATNQDVAEEVLRFYGLSNVPSIQRHFIPSQVKPLLPNTTDGIRNLLVSGGFVELITYSFISPQQARDFGLDIVVEVINPISGDMSMMRTSMLPSMLQHAMRNVSYGFEDRSYFEIGNNFLGCQEQNQLLTASGLRVGKIQRKTIFKEERSVDFFDVKQDVGSILQIHGLKLGKLQMDREVPAHYHPGRSARVRLGKNTVAYFGELHPRVLQELDMKEAVCAFEVILSHLPQPKRKVQKSKAVISSLQAVERDFAFLVKDNLAIGPLLSDVEAVAPQYVEKVQLFDLYRGEKLAPNTQSIAFSIRLRPGTHTFTDAQIDEISNKIISLVQSKYAGVQR